MNSIHYQMRITFNNTRCNFFLIATTILLVLPSIQQLKLNNPQPEYLLAITVIPWLPLPTNGIVIDLVVYLLEASTLTLMQPSGGGIQFTLLSLFVGFGGLPALKSQPSKLARSYSISFH